MMIILPKSNDPTVQAIIGRSLLWVFNFFVLALVIFSYGWFHLAYLIAPYAIVGLIAVSLFAVYRHIRLKEKFENLKFIAIPLIIFVVVLLFGKLVISKHYPSFLNTSSSEDTYESSDHYQGAMD